MILESNKNISQTIRNNIVAFNVYSGIKVIIFNKDTIQINEI